MKTYIVSSVIATVCAFSANAQQAAKPAASPASVDIVSLKNNSVGVNLPSIVTVNQSLPTLGSKSGVLAEGTAGNVNSIAVFPGVVASLEVGQVTILGGLVKAGKVNSVGIGDLRVTQTLPDVAVGIRANKDALIDIGLKNGISITLPLVKLNIPYPKFGKE